MPLQKFPQTTAKCLSGLRSASPNERKVSNFGVQDAVVRNLQTLAESSQRLSGEVKRTEPQIPWRELSGFRNVIMHGYLGVDLGAVWLVVEKDLPGLSEAKSRMAAHLGPEG